ncbi:MAG: sigma-70 family RNA polymerase sigma factor [Agriterribacter sp.]
MQSTAVNATLYTNEDDKACWIDFRNGDRQAFAILYYRYFTLLSQRSQVICDDKELVKDCIHDLFTSIWKNRQRLSIPYSVKAYLLRSIQRKMIREARKRRGCFIQYNNGLLAEGSVVHSVERKIMADQSRQQQQRYLLNAIGTLSKRQQEAVYLKFYANLSYPEIAGKMAISTDSIYNLISKAIDNMQQKLSKKLLHVL